MRSPEHYTLAQRAIKKVLYMPFSKERLLQVKMIKYEDLIK